MSEKWLWQPAKESDFANVTIYNISASLLREFMEKVVDPNYPGGISPAIKGLMEKAIEEQKQKGKEEHAPENGA
jgi:hypothetical protein